MLTLLLAWNSPLSTNSLQRGHSLRYGGIKAMLMEEHSLLAEYELIQWHYTFIFWNHTSLQLVSTCDYLIVGKSITFKIMYCMCVCGCGAGERGRVISVHNIIIFEWFLCCCGFNYRSLFIPHPDPFLFLVPFSILFLFINYYQFILFLFQISLC